MLVKLSPDEMLSASLIGSRRLIESMRAGLPQIGQASRDWSDEIEGAAAEVAVAKAMGLYLDPSIGRYKEKDVGDLHVRYSRITNASLILRDRDPEGRYVLVTGELGSYSIRGWAQSDKVKKPEYRKAPNGRPAAWFVPQQELTQIG